MPALLLLAILAATPRFYDVKFVTCYDADTCYFDFDLGLDIRAREQAVRLCDVNAPELRTATKEAALAAKDVMLSWIMSARVLRVLIPQKNNCEVRCDKKDKYGRWLGWIYADDSNLNDRLVAEGFAIPYIECK